MFREVARVTDCASVCAVVERYTYPVEQGGCQYLYVEESRLCHLLYVFYGCCIWLYVLARGNYTIHMQTPAPCYIRSDKIRG